MENKYQSSDISKPLLRQQIRAQMQRLSAEARMLQSQKIVAQIEASPVFQWASSILLFCPLPDEVQIQPIFERWYGIKQLFLPVIDGNTLKIGRYKNADSLCNTNIYGILEPQAMPKIPPLDLAIVPGVAFDSKGNRLGRGKGFYDNFLHKVSVYKMGVCFDFQYVARVPNDAHDVKMEEIIHSE
jgi:5-formyltetrahydrofolate cyclo-ligase